jgi:hypothetical protein
LLGDLIPRVNRGKAFGALQFFTYLTQAFVYLLVGFLYSYIATWLPFVLFALMAIPLSLIVALKVSDIQVKER